MSPSLKKFGLYSLIVVMAPALLASFLIVGLTLAIFETCNTFDKAWNSVSRNYG